MGGKQIKKLSYQFKKNLENEELYMEKLQYQSGSSDLTDFNEF
jgi:hypothetical protein